MVNEAEHNKSIKPVAVIHTDFSEKFGIPRQAGLVPELEARIELLPEFSKPEAVRELETFSHIWLIWGFSENKTETANLTVRPPRLGGSTRVGVFASRSPFRPNGLGLSVVKLKEIITSKNGISIIVYGADLLDGTPIYDIKPYLPLSDCVPGALEGYTAGTKNHRLKVVYQPEMLDVLKDKKPALIGILEQDPRQTYFQEPSRIYGLYFAEFNIKFKVSDDILEILEVQKL